MRMRVCVIVRVCVCMCVRMCVRGAKVQVSALLHAHTSFTDLSSTAFQAMRPDQSA